MSGINVDGKVLFVTGANRGIGRSLVTKGLENGAKKVYATARDISKLSDLVALNPEKIIALKLDVANADDINSAADLAKDTEIVINNAGVARMANLTDDPDLAQARQEMEVNYFGAYQVALAFSPILKTNGGGAIVNIISVAGFTNFPFASTYSASKAAAHSLTQGLRAELAAQNTLVSGVYPGPIDTDMAKDVDMEKTSPDHVAQKVYDALVEGQEEIFPDPYAVDFDINWRKSAKDVERGIAASIQQNA